MPLPLTPYERKQLAYMQQNITPDIASQVGSQFFGLLGGAEDRFDQNRATRQAGLSSLRELAMQLAGSGAEEDAVSAAVAGQANQLPLMGDRFNGDERVGALTGFVDSLYGDGPISGLAPADFRAQFDTGGTSFDEDDAMAVAGKVEQQSAQGMSFREIREGLRRQFTAVGYDDLSIQEAMNQAESVYERLIGGSVQQMRETGAGLRDLLGGERSQDLQQDDLIDALGNGVTSSQLSGMDATNVEGFMAELVNNPQLYAQVRQAMAQQNEPSAPSAMSSAPYASGYKSRFGF